MADTLPLHGIKVVELTHMVMGPSCGMILADLGAEVIKVEPIQGDNTRRLIGSGAGFFPMFNRNKKSLAIDIKDPRGREVLHKLLATADVFSENFKSGAMQGLGLDYETLSAINPGLIYVSHKGFLPGPYEKRSALDEVVQMMGGLAYMTGPEGRPLRAGSSVNDIMGGMFGVIGVLAALQERTRTGKGTEVVSALFENNVLLVAQHMLQYAVTGQAAAPMPSRISAWGVYDVFTVKDDEQVFLAAVTDTQWAKLCETFNFKDLLADERLRTNNDRVRARAWMMPLLRERFTPYSAAHLHELFEGAGLPYAPITRPEELFCDPHLTTTGGLSPVSIPPDANSSGQQLETHTALLPLSYRQQRFAVRSGPPSIGADTREQLHTLGYTDADIAALMDAKIIAQPDAD